MTKIYETQTAKDIRTVFCSNLRKLSKEKGYTLQKLADAIKVYFGYPKFTYQQVQKYMSGKNKTNFEMAFALAKILNCTLNDFADTKALNQVPLVEYGEVLNAEKR